MSKIYDTIIVGIGPAGISAGIYLKRSNHQVLLIGKDYGALDHGKDSIENYYGFEKINGRDLIQKGINQAINLDIPLSIETVLSIDFDANSFTVETNTQVYYAKTILLATGRTKQKLNVANFNKFLGKGISFCSLCDGFLYRNKHIGIVGFNDYMFHELKILEQLTTNITIFTNGNTLTESVKHTLVDEPIEAILGDTHIEAIKTKQNTYPLDALFIALDAPTSLEFSKSLGIITDKNTIIVNENYMTNIEGLFAAGDIIGGKLQIAKAVYDGMSASFGISKYLKDKKES